MLFVFIISLSLSIISFIYFAWYGANHGSFWVYQFVIDCNKFFSFTIVFSSFLIFKNLNMKYNSVINWIASSTFGIFLIHANSDAMRRWLWGDLLKNAEMYSSHYFIIHALCTVVGVFIVCLLIDKLRSVVFKVAMTICSRLFKEL